MPFDLSNKDIPRIADKRKKHPFEDEYEIKMMFGFR